MSYSLLVPGNRVRFSTHAPALLGARFDDMDVTGVLTYSIATRLRDVTAKHNAVISSINVPGIPADAKDLTYISFTNRVTNEEVILATAWIDSTSIESLTNGKLIVEVGPTSTADVDRIRLTFQEMGYTTINFRNS